MPAPIPDDGWSLTRAGVALVTDADGTISGQQATGLYHRDRRVLSRLRFHVNGHPPVYLNGAPTGAAADRLTYGYWDGEPDPQAVIVRERSLDSGYQERVSIHCFRRPVTLRVELQLAPGGATVYHLDQEGEPPPDSADLSRSVWAEGAAVSGQTISRTLTAQPGLPATFSWGVQLDTTSPEHRPATTVRADVGSLQQAVHTSGWILESLTVCEPRTGLPFLAAGAPHFLALFGRDALCSSVMAMLADPLRALETLEVLAAYQGKAHDPRTLESPGRVLHELRIGDMGVFGLDPGTAYYGSIDATPLFVVAMAECLRWGAPRSRLERLLPAARAALDWCRSHTDVRGFMHSVPHDGGITNQNWKDSGDSIVRPDGTVVQEVTSPVEVQGYFHQALCGLAELEAALGSPDRSTTLLEEADRFKALFHQHFVVDEPVIVALALDAAGEPIPVRASNVGHLLDTGLVDDDIAARLVRRLFSEEEFSGWGVRTLAASEAAYNPLGYHVGSVWPHDNAVLLRGLAGRRFDDATRRLAKALIELSAAERYQLPELLGGFARDQFPEPIPYPASARPQAWAAAVPFQIVSALLGVQPQMHHNRLELRPVLDADQRIIVSGLRLGDRTLDIEAQGSDAEVRGDFAGLTITIGD
ncbi:glycogen debranching N-terminal domain-containing protein [Candidatus Poriferisocius sp.]|uniref:glycogen debranching N-terminal domain-containing protein n=1 Tax=Candidatus Poriferisocius sp. TaxID=3101276 RepID=UPI003B5A5847